MNRQEQRELIDFVRAMSTHAPEATATDLVDLRRLAKRHHSLQERACNEQVPEGHDKRCEHAIRDICTRIGCVPIFSGDPRGCTVILKVRSGYTNDFGQRGVCVPQ